MDSLVSIIVPVYNAEKYLKRCVDSILKQDYPGFELILIDDGSTDGSAQICDAYAAQDTRIRVFHQENAGVSAARNLALDMAKGEYIQFLDSDDWVAPEATRLLVGSLERYDCDMVISDFYRVSGERLAQKGDIEEEKVLSRQEFAACMIENPADFYYGVLWNKLYRRRIIEEHKIRMDTEISWCEDFLFNLEYIRHAASFYALKVPIYYYLKRKGSLVSQGMSISNTVRMKINIFEYYNGFYKDVYDQEDYADIRFQVYSFFFAAAKDGGVPWALLPGSKKLGEERKKICREEIEGGGAAIRKHRMNRIFEYQLELTAKKNSLSSDDALILCALEECGPFTGPKRLAQVTELSQRRVYMSLQRLAHKKLVEEKKLPEDAGEKPSVKEGEKREKGKGKVSAFSLRPEAAKVCRDFRHLNEDLEKICFAGFTEEEKEQYVKLEQKFDENLVRFMIREIPETAPQQDEPSVFHQVTSV